MKSQQQMPKRDLTLQYVNGRKPDGFKYDLPKKDVPKGRRPVPRLSWDIGGVADECSDETFARSIEESALPDAQFYLDTCFITSREIDCLLWSALLRKSIVITTGVWRELQPWLVDPFVNRRFRDLLLEATDVGHPAIRFESQTHSDPRLEAATQFYVQLLGFRKKVVKILGNTLYAELGREATPTELQQRVQTVVQDRGLTLAQKGEKAYGTPNFQTDEAALVGAVVSAVSTGRETTVLTRDSDMVEQFYKLMYLIDTHYRSRAIGAAYLKQPLNFIESPLPTGMPYFDTCFRSGKLISLPVAASERFLSSDHEFVMVHVHRFSPEATSTALQSIGFCAERQMLPLLLDKGFTRGKNTAVLGASNVHRCINPHHQDVFGSQAAVVVDNGVELEDMTIPLVDIEIAVSRREQLTHVARLPPSVAGTYDESILTAYMRANHRNIGRLSWSSTESPIQTTPKQLANTIGLLPSQVRTYVDPSFLASNLENCIQEVLAKTHCGTTRSVFDWCVNQQALPSQCLASAIRNGRAPRWLHIDSSESHSEPHGAVMTGYLAQLMYRKQFGSIIRRKLSVTLERTPSEAEWLQELRTIKGNHELRALDAKERETDSSYYVEDEFISETVINAILAGSDCVILTRRKVVQQQFISMMIQVEQHYRAWAMAGHDPLGKTRSTDKNKVPGGLLQKLGFRTRPSMRGVSRHYADSCLPKDALDLQLQCWLVEGERNHMEFVPVSFLAERPMHAMLKVRGETGGLTTDQLGGDDLMFFWRTMGTDQVGQILRGESTFTPIKPNDFPTDDRLKLSLEKIPTKDLISIVNFCDFPGGDQKGAQLIDFSSDGG
jgi:hypothetical protein